MKLWVKLLAGVVAAGVAGAISWYLWRRRGSSQGGLSPLMENEEVWDVVSDEMGIPTRIVIHRKVAGV